MHAFTILKKRTWTFRFVVVWESLMLSAALWAALHIYFGFPMLALYSNYFDHQPMSDNVVGTFGSVIHLVALVQLVRWKSSAAWLYTVATAYAMGFTIPEGIESGYWVYIWNHNRVLSGIIETYYIYVPSLLVLGYVWYLRLKRNLGSHETK